MAGAAGAQSFSYTDFTNTAELSLLGDAVQTGTTLQLTSTAPQQNGWCWRTTPVPAAVGFDMAFAFRVTSGPGLGCGFAFVIHDDPAGPNAMGGSRQGLGYGVGANTAPGIRNSIAIEFDTFLDGPLGDTSANEISIHTRGAAENYPFESLSIARATPAQSFSDGQLHTVRVVYVPGTIEVYLDGGATPVISQSYDFVSGGLYLDNSPAPGVNLQNGTAYVGFSATTELFTERVELQSWSWQSYPLSAPCYDGTLGADALTVDGSSGGFLRRVELATYQPFTIGVANPPGYGAGAPYVLFGSLQPQPGALGTQLGFGSACFPMLPAGPAELVLADSFGLFPALLPASPTPSAISIPAGTITFPLDLTLQAVTLGSAQPLTLGLTNALDLSVAPAGPPAVTLVAPLSAAVGQPVTVSGEGFVPGLTLTVNGAAVGPTSVTPEEVVFPYPAGVGCGSQLTVRNPDGQSVVAALNPQPVVTSVVFGSGSASGGAFFLIQGSGFAAGTSVTIGGAPAVVVTAGGPLVAVNTPPGTPGPATVVLTTPGGCTATTTYTYL